MAASTQVVAAIGIPTATVIGSAVVLPENQRPPAGRWNYAMARRSHRTMVRSSGPGVNFAHWPHRPEVRRRWHSRLSGNVERQDAGHPERLQGRHDGPGPARALVE